MFELYYTSTDMTTQQVPFNCELLTAQNGDQVITTENFLITNQLTIQQLMGTYPPQTHVEPHNLCMTSIVHCDYSGYVDSGEPVFTYTIPYDHMMGINCIEKYEQNAIDDISNYCTKYMIYPVTTDVLDEMQLNKKNVIVPRSPNTSDPDVSKHVEWFDPEWHIKSYASTVIFRDELCIYVQQNYGDLEKIVSLKRLCELNNIDHESFLSKLKLSLIKYYSDESN